MFFVYKILINITLIFSPIIIFIRLLKKKEDPLRFWEKFGFYKRKRYNGKLIWFHGASVGEILSVIPLIEKLEKEKEIKQILITSNTLSSSKILSKLKLKKTIHQFFPLDTNYLTKKFLNYWNPSAAIFVDSEIWPNMLTNIKERKLSLVLLNARITKKSFIKWKLFISSSKKIFQMFDVCLVSNLKSKKYLQYLGAKNIKYLGNLKFTESEKSVNNLNIKLKKFFLKKNIWCASSTHDTEERICAETHKKLKSKFNNLLTIIIPRHINRTEQITKEIENLNLKVHKHNSTKRLSKDTDIYLVNTFGQTKSFFKICKMVFLGGSIIKHGGQNPLEAVRYGCSILHGPNVWNFDEIYNLLKKYKVSNKINNSNQLTIHVSKMLNNKNKYRNLESKVKNLGNKILNSTLKEIKFYIN
jgi:3-deoxy-D-manno-octulosonic-acid transferase